MAKEILFKFMMTTLAPAKISDVGFGKLQHLTGIVSKFSQKSAEETVQYIEIRFWGCWLVDLDI